MNSFLPCVVSLLATLCADLPIFSGFDELLTPIHSQLLYLDPARSYLVQSTQICIFSWSLSLTRISSCFLSLDHPQLHTSLLMFPPSFKYRPHQLLLPCQLPLRFVFIFVARLLNCFPLKEHSSKEFPVHSGSLLLKLP